MEYIFVILLSLFLLLSLIAGGLVFYKFLLDLQVKYLARKNADEAYELAKISYENLMFARRVFFDSKSIDNETQKSELQNKCIHLHQVSLNTLESIKYDEYKDFLSEEKRKDLERILALPRYELR